MSAYYLISKFFDFEKSYDEKKLWIKSGNDSLLDNLRNSVDEIDGVLKEGYNQIKKQVKFEFSEFKVQYVTHIGFFVSVSTKANLEVPKSWNLVSHGSSDSLFKTPETDCNFLV